MKIQIVYVDPQDDIGSIRDKLLWSKASRALLVWPGRGAALNHQLDIVLLKRAALQQGIAIGLLTHDPDVQSLARKLSIPLFEDLDHLPESSWSIWDANPDRATQEKPPREIKKPSYGAAGQNSRQQPIVRLGLLLMPLSLFLLGLILLAPAAVVEIFPASLREIETITFSLAEQSDATSRSVSFVTLDLDAQGEWRIPTTGSVQVGAAYANGEVEFTNLSEDPIEIPGGTIVRSSNAESPRFRTEQTVSLAGGDGSQVIVGIIAIEPGLAGNVAAGMIDTMEGAIGLRVAVLNQAPTQGGSSQSQAAVSTSDMKRARDELLGQLMRDLMVQASQEITSDQFLLENTLEITGVVQEAYDTDMGTIADSLQVSLAVEAQAIAISMDELQTLIAKSLGPEIPEGYTFVPDSPSILDIREIEIQEISNLEVDVAVRTSQMIDEESLVEELRGASRAQAITFLQENAPGNRAPQISITPSWYPWLPLLNHRITIQMAWEETP